MEDLNALVQVGFTPSDGLQAVAIALVLSMIMKKYAEVWTYTLTAFALDRLLVVLFMFLKGAEPGELAGYVWNSVLNVANDADLLAVRLIGIMLIVSIGFAARCKIHGKFA